MLMNPKKKEKQGESFIMLMELQWKSKILIQRKTNLDERKRRKQKQYETTMW